MTLFAGMNPSWTRLWTLPRRNRPLLTTFVTFLTRICHFYATFVTFWSFWASLSLVPGPIPAKVTKSDKSDGFAQNGHSVTFCSFGDSGLPGLDSRLPRRYSEGGIQVSQEVSRGWNPDLPGWSRAWFQASQGGVPGPVPGFREVSRARFQAS